MKNTLIAMLLLNLIMLIASDPMIYFSFLVLSLNYFWFVFGGVLTAIFFMTIWFVITEYVFKKIWKVD